jgi:cytoskeletal protein RodZ
MSDFWSWSTELENREKKRTLIARLLRLLLWLLLIVGIYWAWQHYFSPPQPVTPLSQTEAQTPAGVKHAAENAQIPLSPAQAEKIAEEIKQAANRPPDATTQTTGAELPQTVEANRKKAKADMAILTRPDMPNSTPDVSSKKQSETSLSLRQLQNQTKAELPPAIKPEDPVILHQYNIKAYPDTLTSINLGLRTASAARVHKVKVPSIPWFLPRGGVGYAGPYIGIIHQQYKKIDFIDGGLTVIF